MLVFVFKLLTFLTSILSATTAIGLLREFKLLIFTVNLFEITFPFHLLGLKGLIGVIANFPEFKDNVTAVFTEKYWDLQLSELVNRRGKVKAKRRELSKDQTLTREQLDKAVSSYNDRLFTKHELKILETGTSNAAYHYLGSAKILTQIGKAFAKALSEME